MLSLEQFKQLAYGHGIEREGVVEMLSLEQFMYDSTIQIKQLAYGNFLRFLSFKIRIKIVCIKRALNMRASTFLHKKNCKKKNKKQARLSHRTKMQHIQMKYLYKQMKPENKELKNESKPDKIPSFTHFPSS
jgi:hypothetical protein